MESLASRAKGVMFEPRATFKEVESEFTKPGEIWGKYVIPLALIGPVAGALSRLVFGRRLGGATLGEPVTLAGALMWGAVAFVIALVAIFLLTQIITQLAPQFGGQKNDVQALKVAAYASTPALVAGIFNIHGVFYIVTILVSIYSLYLLYLGLPILMKVPKDRAMGYTAVVIIGAIVLFLLQSVRDYITF
ncbi:MAG: YIP1 family protein [Gemmatimonadetes bacterium]|nr:MAG: YIP1 family protein [Gemmatimonadota bacterium]